MYKRITKRDRIIIETLYNRKYPVAYIAKEIGKSRQAVYAEIKKGLYQHFVSWRDVTKYSADLAQRRTEYNATARQRPLKVANDYEFVRVVENLIIKNKYSPSAVIGHIQNENIPLKTKVCVSTLYSYIDKGIFLHVTNKDLPRRGSSRTKLKKVRVIKTASKGRSIEKRTEDINERLSFGHWEMDTVVGKKEKAESLLVLTERQTAYEIIIKIPDKTAQSVVDAINFLEKKYGVTFPNIFKSITCDNGVEFSYTERMETSIYGGQRTTLYYCHPYSSWERGQNENQNALIRRFIPKGERIENYSHEYIKGVETWINTLPRLKYGYATSQQLFEMALSKLE